MTAPQTTSASYEVGYRKPPRHTQFKKGQSGNPGGRPRRSLARRLDELALYEAYRTTIVMEDGHAEPMPVIQAVLRSQLQSAASGNVRAQRDILAMIRHIEVVRDVLGHGGADDVVDDTDDADAIDGDDNDNDVDDAADADRDDAGGADDNEPAQQEVDGIDTYGERREEEEREPTVPPAVARARVSSPSPSSGRAGVGSFPRQELLARAPTLPSPASGGGKEEGAPQPENAAGPAGRAGAFATVRLRKRAAARRSAPPQRSRTERRR
jgi:hypothetical protein